MEPPRSVLVNATESTRCDRLLCSFMLVLATLRFLEPRLNAAWTCCRDWTTSCDNPETAVPARGQRLRTGG